MQDATAPDPEPSSTDGNCSVEHDNQRDQEQNHASALLDLRSNHVMQRRLSRDWKIHADVIRSTLKAICVECVCKLNMHSEVTRSLMQRMQRLQRSGGETTKVTTTTTSPSQHSPPIADAEVSTTLIESQEEVAHSGESVRSRSSCSVLEVYLAQQPYSPSAKETEEKHAEGWKWRTRLECHECGRAYFRRDYYAQHLRRCSKTRRKQPRPSRAKCRVLNEASYDEEAPSRVTRSSRIYYCRHCDAEFESLISKRQHERVKHLQRYPCDLCEAQLDTKYEWEMHHTICQAKQELREIGQHYLHPRVRKTSSQVHSPPPDPAEFGSKLIVQEMCRLSMSQ
ncbi:GM19843 [Drosophila sechellia]|uniref:GM19843 n=1 Tax=Drosophila sechellia TaxID=7238 RepID=B4HPD3_DROSE|nr:GM19843 [Drosophila sechellia]